MSIVENGPVGLGIELPGSLTRVLVVAAEARERDRLTGILGRAGQEADAVLADRVALTRHRVDEATLVIVSPPVTATAVRRTLDAGADGLVFESELAQTLIPTVRAVESGQSVVPRNMRAGVERPSLSFREQQVLSLVCEGRTNAQIAEALFLAESTIKSHLGSIFTKLGVHSRKEAGAVFLDLNPSTSTRFELQA